MSANDHREKLNEVQLRERMQILSTISTLIDNGFENAAEFLVQHHEIDPEDPTDQYALSQLADNHCAILLMIE